MPNAAPNYRWDHIHLRSPDPDATAVWFERILGAQVIRSTVEGKPRIDSKPAAPITPSWRRSASGDNVNPATGQAALYQGLDIIAWADVERQIDAVAAATSKLKGVWNSPWSRAPSGPACASASCAVRKGIS